MNNKPRKNKLKKTLLILLCILGALLAVFLGIVIGANRQKTETATPKTNTQSSPQTKIASSIYYLNENEEPVLFNDINDISYITEIIEKDAAALLAEQEELSEKDAREKLSTEGYRIIATVDPEVQNAIDTVYSDLENFISDLPEDELPQSAMVVMDPETGYIKGISGGIGKREGKYTLNRAVDTYRQPGSLFTPLAVYAPAMEAGFITPNTVMEDKKLSGYSPRNYYNGYYGSMSVQRAMELSVNTIPVQIIEELGYEESYGFLRDKFHLDSIVEDDKNPVLALGGITEGVNVMDMTAAYATFANDGTYTEPTAVLEIQDQDGNTIVKAEPETTVAMSPETAEAMHQMLVSVVENGTGTAAQISGVTVAGKTGSTDGDKDRWFVGYTPKYVAATWFGYDIPKTTSYPYNPALKGWKAVMEMLEHE